MPFSIIKETGAFNVVRLVDSDSQTSAEIYSFGALLNSFNISGNGKCHNIIDGFATPQDAVDNITAGFKSARLSPFVCRITAGRYTFAGQEHAINKFFLGTEAIHGLLYDAPFTITAKGADEQHAFVTLGYDYNKLDEGYPFSFHSVITYTLEKDGKLEISTEITNTGRTEMPLTDGWHPYFSLGDNVNDWVFEMNTHEMLEFSDKLVPTGNIIEHTAFSNPAQIGDTFLDNCFVLQNNGAPACTLSNPANGLRLTILAEKNYPYLQVYTPPHRKSIAIENLSGAPDAFNNGIGLIIVKPLEKFTFATVYKIHLSR